MTCFSKRADNPQLPQLLRMMMASTLPKSQSVCASETSQRQLLVCCRMELRRFRKYNLQDSSNGSSLSWPVRPLSDCWSHLHVLDWNNVNDFWCPGAISSDVNQSAGFRGSWTMIALNSMCQEQPTSDRRERRGPWWGLWWCQCQWQWRCHGLFWCRDFDFARGRAWRSRLPWLVASIRLGDGRVDLLLYFHVSAGWPSLSDRKYRVSGGLFFLNQSQLLMCFDRGCCKQHVLRGAARGWQKERCVIDMEWQTSVADCWQRLLEVRGHWHTWATSSIEGSMAWKNVILQSCHFIVRIMNKPYLAVKSLGVGPDKTCQCQLAWTKLSCNFNSWTCPSSWASPGCTPGLHSNQLQGLCYTDCVNVLSCNRGCLAYPWPVLLTTKESLSYDLKDLAWWFLKMKQVASLSLN